MREGQEMTNSVDTFHHRKTNLVWVIVLLAVLFVVFLYAVLFGPGYVPNSSHTLWAWVIGASLFAIIVAFGLVLLRNPKALVISEAGVDIPMAFKHPLRWDEIHRIRRVQTGFGLYGRRDWLIIDPSPGVLAPLRLPVWRKLELWFQSQHGIRIPLHGLEGDADAVVRSIERFRPVALEHT